jgi:hypothetical protein
MSLPLFSSFFSALNVFTDSSASAAYKPGHDSVVRAVQVTCTAFDPKCRTIRFSFFMFIITYTHCVNPLIFFQEVRLDLEKDLRSDAHVLASSMLADALLRHTWSVQEQLAVIDNVECPSASRGSEACVHAAFQTSMIQHMEGCFGFIMGSKPAPSISVRSLSVGSMSSLTAVDISRAFITG